MACSSQIYYGDITKERYKKIVSGNSFYPAKILYHDNSIEEGFVARFPDSNVIRFKKTMETDVRTQTLTERHVKSFIYGLKEYSYPQFVYIDINIRKKKVKIRPVEVVIRGDIIVYMYTWVDVPDAPMISFSKEHYSLNIQFYLEKDNNLYRMNDFKANIIPLIKDKEEVFMNYKKQKIRNSDNYKPFIEIIKLYNMYEQNKRK